MERTHNRRTVVLDIETVALDPNNEKGALDAMSGRVVCIGMLIDDLQTVTEITLADDDERWLVTEFWRTVAPTDVIVGHNIQEFDLRFLRQRSWILGIEPSRKFDLRRYYTTEVIDTLQLWTNWTSNRKGVTLQALAAVLGCGAKTGAGTNVAEWWAERDLERIKSYCQQDVRLTYRVFCRLAYREPKQFSSEVNSASVEPEIHKDVREQEASSALA